MPVMTAHIFMLDSIKIQYLQHKFNLRLYLGIFGKTFCDQDDYQSQSQI